MGGSHGRPLSWPILRPSRILRRSGLPSGTPDQRNQERSTSHASHARHVRPSPRNRERTRVELARTPRGPLLRERVRLRNEVRSDPPRKRGPRHSGPRNSSSGPETSFEATVADVGNPSPRTFQVAWSWDPPGVTGETYRTYGEAPQVSPVGYPKPRSHSRVFLRSR